ncbi:PDR/VanB family oxidoreductase [Comamonadaceae bacterium G21597-S1]|nr:PDR/VanB family oxidoreductase [Comamonadaceae bacterium G21597-S1]
MSAVSRLDLQVASVGAEALDVMRIELVAADGGALPAFEPGAHLAVDLPEGMTRHYSIVNDNRERHRYVLGVGLARDSRGGSSYLHRQMRCGMRLSCSAPANNFRLDPHAASVLLIAGGIGVTPLVSMAHWCAARHKPWRMVYAARSRQRMAFGDDLRQLGGALRLHADDEHGGALDVAALVQSRAPDEQIYCCGPAALMDAVAAAGSALPDGVLHFEWFNAPPQAQTPERGDDGFWVDLRRSNDAVFVPPDRSVLEVLEQHGYEVPFSCREGLCGTCETPVCEGEPDHRDYVLAPSERASRGTMMVCVSRAVSQRLVLDL